MARQDVQINVGARVDQAVSSFEKLQQTLYLNGRRLEAYGSSVGKVFDPAAKGLLVVAAAVKATAVGTSVASLTIAKSLEDAMAVVAQRTGESGEALGEYEKIVRKLYRENTVVDSYGQAAEALAAVRVATGATGKALEDLAQHFLSLVDVTGVDLNTAVSRGVRLFGDWSVAAEDQTKVLDLLFVASEATGASVDDLAEKAVTYGAKFRLLGFSLEETVGLLGKWQKEGVSTERALAGLSQVITNMTRLGVKDLSQGWKDLVENIKNARTEGEAINLAVGYFGARAAPDMAAAIRENRFELGKLAEKLSSVSGAVLEMDESTTTLEERLQMLRQTAKDRLLEPLGTEVARYVAHVADLLDVLVDWADTNEVVKGSVEAFFEGIGLGRVEIDSFRAALESIDVVSFTENFRSFGEMLGLVYRAIRDLASAVPWEALVENADKVMRIIIYGWGAGKVLSIAADIALLASSLKGLSTAMNLFGGATALLSSSKVWEWLSLGGAAKIGTLLPTIGSSGASALSMIGSAASLAAAGLLLFPDAVDEVNYSVEDMAEALGGSREAFDRLPSAIQQWLCDSKQMVFAAEEVEGSIDKMNDAAQNSLDAVPKKMFSTAEEYLAALSRTQPELQISLAVTELEEQIRQIREQGEEAMATLGLSALEAEEIMRASVLKAAEDLQKQLIEASPYMGAAFVDSLARLGREGGDALVTEVAKAMGKKKDLPIETLISAIREGFLTGDALKEAAKLIEAQAEDLVRSTGETIKREFGHLKLSPDLLKGLADYQAKLELGNAGLDSSPRTSERLKALGSGFVRNVNAPVNIQIGNVNVSRPEEARRTGESLGAGIVQAFEMGY